MPDLETQIGHCRSSPSNKEEKMERKNAGAGRSRQSLVTCAYVFKSSR